MSDRSCKQVLLVKMQVSATKITNVNDFMTSICILLNRLGIELSNAPCQTLCLQIPESTHVSCDSLGLLLKRLPAATPWPRFSTPGVTAALDLVIFPNSPLPVTLPAVACLLSGG